MAQAEEFILIRRGIGSHWKVLRWRGTASYLHFAKITPSSAWRMERGHPQCMDEGWPTGREVTEWT